MALTDTELALVIGCTTGGGFLLLVIVIIITCVCCCRRNSNRHEKMANDSTATTNTGLYSTGSLDGRLQPQQSRYMPFYLMPSSLLAAPKDGSPCGSLVYPASYKPNGFPRIASSGTYLPPPSASLVGVAGGGADARCNECSRTVPDTGMFFYGGCSENTNNIALSQPSLHNYRRPAEEDTAVCDFGDERNSRINRSMPSLSVQQPVYTASRSAALSSIDENESAVGTSVDFSANESRLRSRVQTPAAADSGKADRYAAKVHVAASKGEQSGGAGVAGKYARREDTRAVVSVNNDNYYGSTESQVNLLGAEVPMSESSLPRPAPSRPAREEIYILPLSRQILPAAEPDQTIPAVAYSSAQVRPTPAATQTQQNWNVAQPGDPRNGPAVFDIRLQDKLPSGGMMSAGGQMAPVHAALGSTAAAVGNTHVVQAVIENRPRIGGFDIPRPRLNGGNPAPDDKQVVEDVFRFLDDED